MKRPNSSIKNKKISLKLGLYIIFLTLMMPQILGNCAFLWQLPGIELPESSLVFDINGEAIKGLGEESRISIALEDMSDSFIQAIIAVEDKNFYKHHGIDILGIMRAFLTNIKERRISAGGSTITQQTAKNLFLSNERTIVRKLKELVYALQLEREYSKDEILTMYCNTIYFGQGAYGVEVAARTFFAKEADELSLAEAAVLAGMPQWPSKYNPYLNPEEAKKRQAVVLQRMLEENMISEEELDKARAEELKYAKAPFIGGEAPYFIAMVKEYLSDRYGERQIYQGGLRIYTSLDLNMQRAANRAIKEGMQNREADLQVALVGLDVSNGHIRALVGGRDFAASSYNRVYSLRQPGSTFKPFMYSLAISWGFTAADMIMCEEVEYQLPGGDVYRPTDYGEEPYHWREFTLKEAVMVSDNVVAVRLNNQLGPEAVAAHAEKFGFSKIKPVLSLPLGSNEVRPIDMAAAYAVFANNGVYTEPVYILRVEDKEGKILEENKSKQKPVIDAANAYIITDMLKGVLEPGGTGAHLKNVVGRPAAGKTGTTDQRNDAWFVGYTPQLCSAVWVGYDQGKSAGLTGGAAAGPIWAAYMKEASAGIPGIDFSRPENVQVFNICADSGLLACESCPRTISMAFIKGTEPEDICYYHLPYMEWLLEKEDAPWWLKWLP